MPHRDHYTGGAYGTAHALESFSPAQHGSAAKDIGSPRDDAPSPAKLERGLGGGAGLRTGFSPTCLIPITLLLLIPLLLAACADSAKPEDAVPPYLKALLGGDEDQLYRTICPEWEASAKRDLDAFSGITGELKDADCTKAGEDGGYTLVTCTGTMALNYNGELRDRSLEGQTYRVKQIDGDWKMCGYQ